MTHTSPSYHRRDDPTPYVILGIALALAVVSAAHIPFAHALWSDTIVHPPPLKQHDIPAHDIQCNPPRNLYMAWDMPVCLYTGTYHTLISRGADIVMVPPYTAEQMAWLQENPVIRVAYDPYWSPVEYVDESGMLAGVTARYIDEFAHLTGATFQQADVSDWSDALNSIRERSADVMFMVVHTDDRSEYMGFTAPHYSEENRLITLHDTDISLTDENLRLLTVRDYAIETWLDQNHPDVSYISVDDIPQGFEMLQRGEADAFALTWPAAQDTAATEGIPIYDAGPTGYAYHLSIGYRNDQPVLGSILQKTLDAIPASTLERMQDIASYDTPTGLTATEMAWLQENPVIRVAYDPHWPPVEYVDESGNPAGVTIRYIDEFAHLTGATFQPHISVWSDTLNSMRERSVDVIFMVAHTDDRSEYMGFTTPHYTVETRLVTLHDTTLDITYEHLQLLTLRDYAIETWLDQNHPDISYISVDDIPQGFEMLQRGEADAFALTWPAAQDTAATEGIPIYDAGPTGYAYHLSIGYRNDQPVLGSILQKTLDSIPASTLERIQDIASDDTPPGLTAEEMAWLQENPVIRVAYDPHWPPIEYVDDSGMLAGVTARYIDEFAYLTGATFQQADISNWSDALNSMRERSVDVIFMVANTDDRSEYMNFTTPHYTVETRLIALHDTTLDMTDENLRLLTVRDYAIESWLDQNRPDISYISADDIPSGFEMLQRGEADAFALTWLTALDVAAAKDIPIYDAGPTGYAYHLSIGYRNDQPVLGSILQKTLDSIPESTLERMQDIASHMPGQN